MVNIMLQPISWIVLELDLVTLMLVVVPSFHQHLFPAEFQLDPSGRFETVKVYLHVLFGSCKIFPASVSWGPIYEISYVYHTIILSLSSDRLTIVTYNEVKFLLKVS